VIWERRVAWESWERVRRGVVVVILCFAPRIRKSEGYVGNRNDAALAGVFMRLGCGSI
jgi:hypothetical protein